MESYWKAVELALPNTFANPLILKEAAVPLGSAKILIFQQVRHQLFGANSKDKRPATMARWIGTLGRN